MDIRMNYIEKVDGRPMLFIQGMHFCSSENP